MCIFFENHTKMKQIVEVENEAKCRSLAFVSSTTGHWSIDTVYISI